MKTTTKITLSMATMVLLSSGLYAVCENTVDMGGNTIKNLAFPIGDDDATSKIYVDKYVGQYVTQGAIAIVAPAGYRVIYKGRRAWLDRNIGATVAPTAWDDETQASRGSLFQWGRAADGHQFRDIGEQNNDADVDVTPNPACADTDAPGTRDFYSGNASGDYNWRTIATDCNEDARKTYLWSAPGSLRNGVCPAGWRVPSEEDFRSLDIESAQDAYAKIKLSVTGFRSNASGSIFSVGTLGLYWTSNVDGSRSRYLSVYSDATNFDTNSRAYAVSVRCVKHLQD